MIAAATRIAVALCCLLAVASPASAECAWVLWTETNQKYLNRDDPRSTRNDNYPVWGFDRNVYGTRTACEAALTSEMAATVKSFQSAGAQLFQPPGEAPDFFIRLWERRVAIQKQPGGKADWFLIYEYACLPDTLDPRGPKREAK